MESSEMVTDSVTPLEARPPLAVEDKIDSGVPNGAATETPLYDEKTQEKEYRANMPKPGKAEDDQLTKFRSEVKIILHTVNENEYQAAITFMEPPMETLDRPVKYCHESDMVVYLGIFAEKKSVLIRTKPGAGCRDEIEEVLEAYHTARYVFAVGVCFGFNREKVQLGDVLVSEKISDFANYKFTEKGEIIDRGNRMDAKPFLFNNFCKDPIHDPSFEVTTDKRNSKVHSGLILSQSILFDNREMRDKFHAAEPEAIGGEMEGGVVMKLLTKEKYTKKGVIVIKGVVDFADGNKGKVWQYTAAKAALHYTWSKLKDVEIRDQVSSSNSAALMPAVETDSGDVMDSAPLHHSKISADEFDRVMEILQKYPSKWRKFGQGLGFKYQELEEIESRDRLFKTAPSSYLDAMLNDWKEWAPGDARGRTDYANMDSIRNAVDKAGLGKTAREM